MPFRRACRVPAATYRLQLHRDFTFLDLERAVPYLADLGIDTVYLSPILMSTPGSSHGYDVSDYRRIDAELGGREGFERLVSVLHAHGLGVLLDFVPNHMGIDGPFNVWWNEVLESGRQSPHAHFFDIFWTTEVHDRIHLPLLEDHYGRVLEAGKLTLEYSNGSLTVAYGSSRFPLTLPSYLDVFVPVADDGNCPVRAREALGAWLATCRELARDIAEGAHAEAQTQRLRDLKSRLKAVVDADDDLQGCVTRRLAALNGKSGAPRSFDALHRILEDQHYRLARWQTGAHETNYRRFFAIDSLVGLRMEIEDVFRDSHALVRQLMASGAIDGLRIDHIDGLRDPAQYLERVQALAQEVRAEATPLYLVVEKILAAHESLAPSWPIHGTTGYEFITSLAGLFVASDGEEAMTQTYAAATGRAQPFRTEVSASKHVILEDVLANTVTALARDLSHLIQEDRCWRDFSRHELRTAIREIMSSLRVYRTYRRIDDPTSGPVPAEVQSARIEIEHAAARAVRANPLANPEVFHFVRDILTGDYPGTDGPKILRDLAVNWALTFQQHTGAVMAKAVEDTAFYNYNRLIALNEVGGEPGRFGATLDEFHRANHARLGTIPHSLLATSTHDTKLSEDARARLYVLSELTDEWDAWVSSWRGRHRTRKTLIDGLAAPDPDEEYRLYQSILAVWPLTGAIDDGFRTRIRQNLRKSTQEARVHSSWQRPNEAWLEAGASFADAILSDSEPGGFLETASAAVARLAMPGAVNSLAQVVLKLTCPGVPDTYQGTDTWDLSLVDPDNRRPVDYEQRHALLARARATNWSVLLDEWQDGALKIRVMRDLFRFRHEHRALFDDGDYRPLAVSGPAAHHVIAFARTHHENAVIVLVPRLTARLGSLPPGSPPIKACWRGTVVELANLTGVVGEVTDLLTGAVHQATAPLVLEEIFGTLPIAVLLLSPQHRGPSTPGS